MATFGNVKKPIADARPLCMIVTENARLASFP